MASPNGVTIYKEGILMKRARGLHNRRNIKWQDRYCRLTNISLDYFDPKKLNEPKGQFKLAQINIIEIIAHGTFDKLKGHPFQIGDLSEVMYFASKSPQERNDWMEAFRLAAINNGNELLLKHHPGVYGLTNKDRWSCCGRARRECEGCVDSKGALKILGHNVDGKKERSKTTPMDFVTLGDDRSSPSPIRDSKEDLSGSIKSDISDSTLTEPNEEHGSIRRTFTIADTPPRPQLKKQSASAPSSSTILPKSPTLSDTIEEEETKEDKENTEKESRHPSSMHPPQIDDITRSGASSPALSTDSGHGTSSRPASMVTYEGENLPLTPHSTRSTFTTVTTDSDPTKSLGGDLRSRNIDTLSILSDVSGTSGFSGTLSNPLTRIKRAARPQSVILKDGSVILLEPSSTSESNMGEGIAKLHQACKDGNLEIVKDELDTGAPIGGQEIFNGLPMLPLFIAFLHDHRHIMTFLMDHGADPNALDMVSRSCLMHMACQRGCKDIVEMLIRYKADINMRNHEDNTPLCEASKNGHKDIVEVLIDKGATVDFEGGTNHTPLHYAAEAGHYDIVEFLLKKGANPMKKTKKNNTAYHLAFTKGHTEIMRLIQDVLPPKQRPYQLKDVIELPSEQVVSSLSFREDQGCKPGLVTGSWDCMTRVWEINEEGLTQVNEIRLPNTVLGLAYHTPYIAMGTTSIQVVDSTNYEWRRIVADDVNEDESLEDPPLHHVAYTPDGHLITAAVESNIIKIWPPTTQDSVIKQPIVNLYVEQEKSSGRSTTGGSISRLCLSTCEDAPWLATVLQPGPLLTPSGNKKVHIFNWKEHKMYHIIDTGQGGLKFNVHLSFSPGGRYLMIGCENKLTKVQSDNADILLSSTLEKTDEITSLAYSPSGDHVAVGLASGDIKIINSESGILAFTLRHKDGAAAVTSLLYSQNRGYMASGHLQGLVLLWEVYNAQSSTRDVFQ